MVIRKRFSIVQKKTIKFNISFSRIYPDQLTTLGGLAAYPITATAQPQAAGVRYITATTPHSLTTAGQPTGTYTFGYVEYKKRIVIEYSRIDNLFV